MSKCAVFLDRDGVVNREVQYLSHPDQIELIRGAAEAVRRLNEAKYLVIVVTNQAGIARGYFTHVDLALVHRKLQSMLVPWDAHIDEFYCCPHHPTAGVGQYRIECNCRKPNPGLLFQAARDFDLDLSQCYMIGDKVSDIQAGWRAGCVNLLVLTGYGARARLQFDALPFKPDFVAADLLSAVEWILERESVETRGNSHHLRKCKVGYG